MRRIPIEPMPARPWSPRWARIGLAVAIAFGIGRLVWNLRHGGSWLWPFIATGYAVAVFVHLTLPRIRSR